MSTNSSDILGISRLLERVKSGESIEELTSIERRKFTSEDMKERTRLMQQHGEPVYDLIRFFLALGRKNPSYLNPVLDYLKEHVLIINGEVDEYVLRSSVQRALTELEFPVQVGELERLM